MAEGFGRRGVIDWDLRGLFFSPGSISYQLANFLAFSFLVCKQVWLLFKVDPPLKSLPVKPHPPTCSLSPNCDFALLIPQASLGPLLLGYYWSFLAIIFCLTNFHSEQHLHLFLLHSYFSFRLFLRVVIVTHFSLESPKTLKMITVTHELAVEWWWRW